MGRERKREINKDGGEIWRVRGERKLKNKHENRIYK